MQTGIAVHIAILVTNTDRSAFAAGHPRDGEKFTALLTGARPGWRATVFDCTQGQAPADPAAFDGLLIGGSPASVHDADPWIARLLDLIRLARARAVPMLGACFGHQAIALALGGTVGPNAGPFVLGVVDATLDGRPVRIAAAHGEQVIRLPEGAVIRGTGPGCPAAFYSVGSRILCTQYHPEMTPAFIAGLVAHLGGDADARASLADPPDPALHGEWVARFFETA
jgi:GMP synthase-like glutamine amidotransferase